MTAIFDIIMKSIIGRDIGLDRKGDLYLRGTKIVLGYDSNAVTLDGSAIAGGAGTFANSCAYTLAAGTTHNLGPAPTSGLFAAGTTNRFILTPNAGGSTVDSITAPATDGMVIMLYNPSLTLSLTLLDINNASVGGTAANRIALPNPNGLAANAIVATLPPQSAQKLTYYSDRWVVA